MTKIYHLSTCSTCKRIIEEIGKDKFDKFQDIKTEAITSDQLDAMKALSGSYESLFSRRSRQFRPMGLHEKELSEEDYKSLILQEYSFLKRPVIIADNQIFVGNSKKEVEKAKASL
ncbi:arsenate reductase [Flammeovirga sp. MY04]|uniref:arsenate reductase family protein n=1 Tax=Flammeovirga sp. MY04 TaxID=1191459 RepID=UPI0008061699|nr:ArsC/Spx/MgsR family protein [Flammeovirga sp. MY04]ANQ48765.1 arsenate reductase [Flammeovirga sp. MY04]